MQSSHLPESKSLDPQSPRIQKAIELFAQKNISIPANLLATPAADAYLIHLLYEHAFKISQPELAVAVAKIAIDMFLSNENSTQEAIKYFSHFLTEHFLKQYYPNETPAVIELLFTMKKFHLDQNILILSLQFIQKLFKSNDFKNASIILTAFKHHSSHKVVEMLVKYCNQALGEETKSEPKTLDQSLIDTHHDIYNKSYNAFLQRRARLPSELIATCEPEKLYELHHQFYDFYRSTCKYSSYPNLELSAGNGGFAMYKKLNIIPAQTAHMTNYGYSQPKIDTANLLHTYLFNRGMTTLHYKPDDYHMLLGQGSTQLYDAVISKMFSDRKRVIGKDVLLVPTPTYGLFVPQVYYAGGEIKTIPLLATNHYKLTALQLDQAIIATNAELQNNALVAINFHYKQFLLSAAKAGIDVAVLPVFQGANSEVKTDKLVSDLRQITNVTLELAKKIPHLKAKIDLFGKDAIPLPPQFPKVLGFYHANIHNPTGQIYTQSEVTGLDIIRRSHDITVIEDLSHHELNFSSQKLGYFSHGRRPYKQATLFSISKVYCAAAWRVGFGMFSNDFICNLETSTSTSQVRAIEQGLSSKLFSQSVFINPYQEEVVRLAFDINDKDKDKYIQSSNNIYRDRYIYFEALIEGVKSKTPPEFLAACSVVIKYNPTVDADLLFSGVPNIRLLTKPQGSFFVLLDFSYYIGKYFANKKLVSALDICEALLSNMNIDVISGEGMITTLPIVRVSLNVDYPLLEMCAVRLREFVKLITDKPAEVIKREAVAERNLQTFSLFSELPFSNSAVSNDVSAPRP